MNILYHFCIMEKIILGDLSLSSIELVQLIADGQASMEPITLNNKQLLFITLREWALSHFLIPKGTKEALKLIFKTGNKLKWRKNVKVWDNDYALFYETNQSGINICHILDGNWQYPEVVKWWYIRYKITGYNWDNNFTVIFRKRISDGKINWMKDQMYSEAWWLEKDESYEKYWSPYKVCIAMDGTKMILGDDHRNNSFKILGSYSEIVSYHDWLIGLSEADPVLEDQKAIYYSGEDCKSWQYKTKERYIHKGEWWYSIQDIQDIIEGKYWVIIVTRSNDEDYRIWNTNGQEISWDNVSINEKPKYERNINWWFFIINNWWWISHIIQDVPLSKTTKQDDMINVQGEYRWILGTTYIHYSDWEKDILLWKHCKTYL